VLKRLFQKLRRLGDVTLTWGGYALACLGGWAATTTFIGALIAWAVDLLGSILDGIGFPTDVKIALPFVLIGVGFVFICGDLFRDGIPERLAFYLTIVWPSFFRAIPNGNDSKLREKFTGWSDGINEWLDGKVGPWIGDVGTATVTTIIAVVCISVAMAQVERYSKGAAAAASASAATTASTPATRSSTPATRRTGGRGR
jgi:hypothetical protein